MTLTFSGCASLNKQLTDAAKVQGTAEAKVVLPDWPTECRRTQEHAPLAVGTEVRVALHKERSALNRANRTIKTCAQVYDDLKEGLLK